MSQHPEKTTESRIPSLDGIRAIAILFVLVGHASNSLGFPVLIKDHLNFTFGTVGVRIFFVISGFLITTLLIKEELKTGTISLSAFYGRRALRIFPAYYSYIAFFYILTLFFPYLACPVSTFLSSATFTTQLWGYWEMCQRGSSAGGFQCWPLSHTWSLAMEEQFYLFWPTMLYFFPWRSGFRKLLVAILIFVVVITRILLLRAGVSYLLIEHLFITQADSLMMGCLLALALNDKPVRMRQIFNFQPTLFRAVAVLVIYFAYFLQTDFFIYSEFPFRVTIAGCSPALQSLGIGYLIGSYTLVARGPIYQLLNLPFMRWLGVLSYSIYLYQQPFLAPAIFYSPHWFQTFPQNLILALACAIVSYFVIEKPFLLLKARFSRLNPRREPDKAAASRGASPREEAVQKFSVGSA